MIIVVSRAGNPAQRGSKGLKKKPIYRSGENLNFGPDILLHKIRCLIEWVNHGLPCVSVYIYRSATISENMKRAQNNKLAKTLMIAAAAMLSSVATPAFAKTVTSKTTVDIVTPLSFFISDQLNFGTVLAGTTAGTVILAPTGVRTKTGGVTLVGNSQQVATFSGRGRFNQAVDISMGANTINLTGPGAPMQVRTWVIGSTPSAILTAAPLRFRIGSATGVFSFPLGATLAVGANQAPGIYTGTYSVTLQYQ
jgi:hypothetical protein